MSNMKKPTYSNGPWAIYYNGRDRHIRSFDGVEIITGIIHGKENAKLIEAAPEMFEALKKALYTIEGEEGSDTTQSDNIKRILKNAGDI